MLVSTDLNLLSGSHVSRVLSDVHITLYSYKSTRSRAGPPITALIPSHPYLLSMLSRPNLLFPNLDALWAQVASACGGLGRYGPRVRNIRHLASEIEAPALQRLLGHKRTATTLHYMADALTPTHRRAAKRLRH